MQMVYFIDTRYFVSNGLNISYTPGHIPNGDVDYFLALFDLQYTGARFINEFYKQYIV